MGNGPVIGIKKIRNRIERLDCAMHIVGMHRKSCDAGVSLGKPRHPQDREVLCHEYLIGIHALLDLRCAARRISGLDQLVQRVVRISSRIFSRPCRKEVAADRVVIELMEVHPAPQ